MRATVLTILVAAGFAGGARAQTTTWLERGDRPGAIDWYLPKVAGATFYTSDLIVPGQQGTGTGDLNHNTANYPGGDYVNWYSAADNYAVGSNPSVSVVAACLTFNGSCSSPQYDAIVEAHQGRDDSGTALYS